MVSKVQFLDAKHTASALTGQKVRRAKRGKWRLIRCYVAIIRRCRKCAGKTSRSGRIADERTGGDAFRYRPGRMRYPKLAFRDGKVFSADLGVIEKGRTYQLLFEMRPPEDD